MQGAIETPDYDRQFLTLGIEWDHDLLGSVRHRIERRMATAQELAEMPAYWRLARARDHVIAAMVELTGSDNHGPQRAAPASVAQVNAQVAQAAEVIDG